MSTFYWSSCYRSPRDGPSFEAWALAAEKRRAICEPPPARVFKVPRGRVTIKIGNTEIRGYSDGDVIRADRPRTYSNEYALALGTKLHGFALDDLPESYRASRDDAEE